MIKLILILHFIGSGSQLYGDSQQGKYFILSIGINSYDNPHWQSLSFADKDAEDIYNYFKGYSDGGLLLNSRINQRVTRDDVLKSLERLNQSSKSERDTVIVYISSHGTVGETTISDQSRRIAKYLVSSDTDPQNLKQTGISHKKIFEIFNKLKSRKKVLILDSCYSGGGKSKLTNKILQELSRQKSNFFKEPPDFTEEGTIILSASAWGEEAQESKELKNGLYTHFLLKGFNQDFNQDGAVSITEAHQYAVSKVIEYSRGKQHPTAKMELVGQDPILVNGKPGGKGAPLLYSYEWFMRKFSVEVEGRQLGQMKSGGLLVPEGKGRLIVRKENGDVVIDKYVEFEAGREYPLAAFLYYEPKLFVDLGFESLSIHDSEIKAKLLPRTLTGGSLDLRRLDLWNGLGLGLKITKFQESHESVKSEDRNVKQSLSSWKVGMYLTKEYSFVKSEKLSHKLFGTIEPSLIFLKRNLEDTSFLSSEQEANLASIGGSFGIRSYFNSVSSTLSLAIKGGLIRNTLPFGPSVMVFSSLDLAWGWHW